MSAPGNARGELEIVSEEVMCAVPRGDEMLRVTFTRARTAQGRDVAWHSIRVFWKNDQGEWKPGKQGITVRGGELKAVAEALSKAVSGGAKPTAAVDNGIPF